MKKQLLSTKKNQLKTRVKQLNFLLKKESLETESKIKNLVLEIRNLIRELSYLFSRRALKRMLGAAAILIGLGFANRANAQSFAPPQVNPFGLDSINGYLAAPAFADLDGDGDLDLLVGEAYNYNSDNYSSAMQYFENIGTAANPQFAAPQVNPFGLDSTNYFTLPAFADLDGDGDIDLLVGEAYGVMQYFENVGSTTNPQFAEPLANPFGLDSTYILAFPSFADLDGDGDIDLLVGESEGALQYFENTGTASSPQFAASVTNPFGLDSLDSYLAAPAFVDLDNDGDFDLFAGSSDYIDGTGVLNYFENTGTSSNPQFASPQINPFGLVSTYQFSLPAVADIDDDGDFDLLVGEYVGAMQYFENIEIVGIAELDQLNLDIYPNPVRDVLNIKVETQIDRIEIFDISGKMINVYDKPGKRISLSDLQPGMYMLKITSVDGNFTAKKIQKL